MAKFVCTAQLLQNTIDYKELNFNQYRQLLKCFLGDDVYSELIFSNVNNVIKELTDLTDEAIKNLNFLDYCLLLLDIRQTCIGNNVHLYVETPEQKQIKIDLQIYKIIDLIKNDNLIKLLEPEIIDTCIIEYKLPTIKEIISLEKESEIFTPYTFFVKALKFSNTVINLQDYSFIEREKIIQKVPLKVMTALTKRSHALIEHCNNLNLLESIKNDLFNKELILTLNSEIIAFIIKLIFNTNLNSVYECMFALSKMANISCSFLENCSPGEFYIFVKKLEELNSKTPPNKSQSQDILPPINSEANFSME